MPLSPLERLQSTIDLEGHSEIDALLDDVDRRLDQRASDPAARSLLTTFLRESARPSFLRVADAGQRLRWVELCRRCIRHLDYRVGDLLHERATELGDEVFVHELGAAAGEAWSYRAVERRVREWAAALIGDQHEGPRRVALLTDNRIEGICADLACLSYDLLSVPMSVHLDDDQIGWILRRLQIDVVLTDTEDRLRRLRRIADAAGLRVELLGLVPEHASGPQAPPLLAQLAAELGPAEIERRLAARPRIGPDDACTVMFTSGSTGRPRGVAFPARALVFKRFARAAALPEVGEDEHLLAYLPLYHTFGRFLELLGTLFWRGTYVLAENPSLDSLLQGMKRVRPTGFVSVPLRWQQLRQQVLDRGGDEGRVLAELTGGRLRWGLSAAGHLDPRVFRFFRRNGVALCSGFGMTEATGGITMSPPDDYVEETVGVPLPGIEVELDERGQMLIRGDYVARYLPEEETEAETSLDETPGGGWLATGDVFRKLERGHLQIVDRIKDVYKNIQGQTIAPRRVESQFQDVPGIRRVFLVGDHRPFNTLLVVADETDPVLRDAPDAHARHEYFRHVIAAANRRLAPFERVVDYTVLPRDFSAELGELTPKGSYRRLVILENFAETIERLYAQPYVSKKVGPVEVRIPRWLLRDLGIVEDHLEVSGNALVDRQRGSRLRVAYDADRRRVTVGDLAYAVEAAEVDLGPLTRQPRLWLGNRALLDFAPVKEGWDDPARAFGATVFLPAGGADGPVLPPRKTVHSGLLGEAETLCEKLLRGDETESALALEGIADLMPRCDDRLDHALRLRLTALAEHARATIRCAAYRTLLLDRHSQGYDEAFGPFIDSGLSFLDADTIAAIARAPFGRRRLEALRQRLSHYREEPRWPADETVRRQFTDVFRLLADFAREQPEYYHPVRCELASWSLHEDDPDLAGAAQEILSAMVLEHESRLERAPDEHVHLRQEQIAFDEDVGQAVRDRIFHLLAHTGFLCQSVRLAYNDPAFETRRIRDRGLWVATNAPGSAADHFRLSVRTVDRRHYELLLVLRNSLDDESISSTNYWMLAIGGHPFGERPLPRFGCARPELGAMSVEYVDEPTVSDRLRSMVESLRAGEQAPERLPWRQIWVRSLSAVVRVWCNSGRRLVPGTLRPSNVVVPALDFREGARVLSLAGWQRYQRPRDLLSPMWKGFFERVRAQYPECEDRLEEAWIPQAFAEVLAEEPWREFLEEALGDAAGLAPPVRDALRAALDGPFPVPLALTNAVARYRRWHRINPSATATARVEQTENLLRLYQLDRKGEYPRYYLYRHTCFDAASAEARAILDRLLLGARADSTSLSRRVELCELRACLRDEDEVLFLSRMLFPHARRDPRLDVLSYGEPGHERVTIRTRIVDRLGQPYEVREPIDAEEVGQVYRVFYREQFARAASEADCFLVALDRDERVIGALIHRRAGADVLHVDGIVVRAALWGRGIATALLEDLCVRAAGQGVRVVKTDFILRRFFQRRGFRVDRRWGGLVRFLTEDDANAALPTTATDR